MASSYRIGLLLRSWLGDIPGPQTSQHKWLSPWLARPTRRSPCCGLHLWIVQHPGRGRFTATHPQGAQEGKHSFQRHEPPLSRTPNRHQSNLDLRKPSLKTADQLRFLGSVLNCENSYDCPNAKTCPNRSRQRGSTHQPPSQSLELRLPFPWCWSTHGGLNDA